jgi:hypothetical protein
MVLLSYKSVRYPYRYGLSVTFRVVIPRSVRYSFTTFMVPCIT